HLAWALGAHEPQPLPRAADDERRGAQRVEDSDDPLTALPERVGLDAGGRQPDVVEVIEGLAEGDEKLQMPAMGADQRDRSLGSSPTHAWHARRLTPRGAVPRAGFYQTRR